MNKKIVLAYFAIGLSVVSLAGLALDAGIWVFASFSAGCLAYSSLALFLFKKNGTAESSNALLGGLIALTFVLLVHVGLITMVLYAPDSGTGEWGWQFLVTLLGVLPAVILGAIIGWVIDSYRAKKLNSFTPPQPRGRIF